MTPYPIAGRMVRALLCLLPLLSPLPAQALMVFTPHTASALSYCGDTSRLYTAGSSDVPTAIAASFTGDGKRIVFRTCHDMDGNTHYFIREPRPNRNGVCRTFENEVFEGTAQDRVIVELLYDGMADRHSFTLAGWKAWPPQEWTLLHYARQSAVLGFVTGQDCPPGDDTRYIDLKNVTDGMLASFQRAWDAATRSPAALADAFAAVPTASAFSGKLDARPSQALRARFQEAVFVRHEKVNSIQCHEGGCTAYLQNQGVTFDVTAKGIAFTSLIALFQA